MVLTVGEVNAVLKARDESMSATMTGASAKVKGLSADLKELNDTSKAAGTGLGGVGDTAEKSGEQMTQLDRVATRLVERMVILYALKETANFTIGLFKSAEALRDLLEQSDLSLEKLQEIQFAADQTGVPFTKATTAIDTFDKKLAEMKMGTADALAGLGLSFEKLFAMNPDERFDAVAAAIAKLPTQLQRTKAEVELFGTDAIDPLIKNFENLKKSALESGQILDTDTINTLADTAKMYRGLGDEVGAVASKMIIDAQNVIAAWAAPVFGGNLDKWKAMMLAFALTGNITDAIAEASRKTPTDINLPKDGGPSKGGGLTGQAYVDSLWAESMATKALTEAQKSELGQLRQMNLLTADNAAKIGLTTAQYKMYTAEIKAQEKEWTANANEAKKYNKAWEDLNSTGDGWKGTVAGIDGATKDLAESYLKAGASASAVATGLKLTQAQVHALTLDIADQTKQAKVAAEAAANTQKIWDEYFVVKDKMAGDSYKTQIDLIWKEYDAEVKSAEKKGIATAAFYDAATAKALASEDAIQKARELQDTNSKASFQQRLDDAQREYDFKINHAGDYTQKDIEMSRMRRDAARAEWQDWHNVADAALGKTITQMQQLTKEWKLSGGGSFTLPDLTEADIKSRYGNDAQAKDRLKWIQDYYRMYPGAAPGGSGPTGLAPGDSSGWQRLLAMQQEYTQLKNFLKMATGGTLGAGPGNVDGYGNVLLGEHGPEAVRLPIGSTVFPTGSAAGGGGTINLTFHVNGTARESAQAIKEIIMKELKTRKQFSLAGF